MRKLIDLKLIVLYSSLKLWCDKPKWDKFSSAIKGHFWFRFHYNYIVVCAIIASVLLRQSHSQTDTFPDTNGVKYVQFSLILVG